MILIPLIIVGYLLGSFPTAYIITRMKEGVDIRKVGSGNPGGANVMTQVGFLWGALAGGIDVIKGLLAVILAMWLDIPLWR